MKVLHYETVSGNDPIREFLEGLPPDDRAACDEVIGFLASGEIDDRPTNRDYIGDGIRELRLTSSGLRYRVLYMTTGDTAHILVAFIKKTPQTPKRHIDLAKKRMRELKKRRSAQ